MSINLPYSEGTSERLLHKLRSHKIRSTFCTENTFRKILCTTKDWVAIENKNNIVCKIDCSHCEAVCICESKRFLKSRSDEHKSLSGIKIVIRMKLQKTVGKRITALAAIRRALLIRKAGAFLGRSKKPYILWRILITLTKFPTCFLKYGYLFSRKIPV